MKAYALLLGISALPVFALAANDAERAPQTAQERRAKVHRAYELICERPFSQRPLCARPSTDGELQINPQQPTNSHTVCGQFTADRLSGLNRLCAEDKDELLTTIEEISTRVGECEVSAAEGIRQAAIRRVRESTEGDREVQRQYVLEKVTTLEDCADYLAKRAKIIEAREDSIQAYEDAGFEREDACRTESTNAAPGPGSNSDAAVAACLAHVDRQAFDKNASLRTQIKGRARQFRSMLKWPRILAEQKARQFREKASDLRDQLLKPPVTRP